MKTKRLSFIPWYTSDFAGATRGWCGCARLIYRELLDAQFDMGGLPNDPEQLRRIVQLDAACWERGWQTVAPKFVVCDDGKLRNLRLEEHRERAQQLSQRQQQAGKAGAQARWQRHSKAGSDPGSNSTPQADEDGFVL